MTRENAELVVVTSSTNSRCGLKPELQELRGAGTSHLEHQLEVWIETRGVALVLRSQLVTSSTNSRCGLKLCTLVLPSISSQVTSSTNSRCGLKRSLGG